MMLPADVGEEYTGQHEKVVEEVEVAEEVEVEVESMAVSESGGQDVVGRRLRSGVTQRTESAKMWSDHQGLGGNGPCRREKGGSPAFLKSCGCAPLLK